MNSIASHFQAKTLEISLLTYTHSRIDLLVRFLFAKNFFFLLSLLNISISTGSTTRFTISMISSTQTHTHSRYSKVVKKSIDQLNFCVVSFCFFITHFSRSLTCKPTAEIKTCTHEIVITHTFFSVI